PFLVLSPSIPLLDTDPPPFRLFVSEPGLFSSCSIAPPCNSSELRIVVKILCFRLSNKSLNTPFPKKINTPKTTLRFIRFV
ncbi:hypothetical protein LINPERPRIM_LOCUS42843, partial [Linum perenne]